MNPALMLLMRGPVAASSWTPASIASTVLWLDSSDTSTITADAGAVSSWASKVGSYAAVQSTAGVKPTTGTTTLNSLNVLAFDGGDALTVPSFDLSGTDDISAWAIFTSVSGGDRVVMEHSSNYNTNNGYILLRASNNTVTWDQRVSAYTPFKTTATVTTSPKVITATADRTLSVAESLAWVDGTKAGTTFTGDNSASNFANDALYIGGREASSLFLSGYIAEVGVCSTAISDTDREKLEGYLAHKWGLAAQLPEAHPYKSTAP